MAIGAINRFCICFLAHDLQLLDLFLLYCDDKHAYRLHDAHLQTHTQWLAMLTCFDSNLESHNSEIDQFRITFIQLPIWKVQNHN